VLVGTLAQIDCRQVKTEHFHRADQRVQALGGQGCAVVGLQRGFNHLQIGQEGFRAGVGILGCDGVARRVPAGQCLQCGG
jgi:hypothetical protein